MLWASQNATSIDKRDICLQALGHSQNPALVARTLDLALSPDSVARTDMRKYTRALRTHAPGIKAMWDWLQADSEDIQKTLGQNLGTYAHSVQKCTINLARKEQWTEVRLFFEDEDTQVRDPIPIVCQKVLS